MFTSEHLPQVPEQENGDVKKQGNLDKALSKIRKEHTHLKANLLYGIFTWSAAETRGKGEKAYSSVRDNDRTDSTGPWWVTRERGKMQPFVITVKHK